MAIKLFADGADLDSIAILSQDGTISGFTTNPSLVRKAGVSNYAAFGKEALARAHGLPVSIEVIADDFDEMRRQAHKIVSWGPNAVVKIPVMTTKGVPSYDLIRQLAFERVPLNVTAVMTKDQVKFVGEALSVGGGTAIVSVFAGRIADCGVDPLDHMSRCRYILGQVCPRAQLLWASPRQVYDITLAERAKCDIITVTADLLAKRSTFGKNLEEYSRETVRMFFKDAVAAGLDL